MQPRDTRTDHDLSSITFDELAIVRIGMQRAAVEQRRKHRANKPRECVRQTNLASTSAE